MLERRVEQNGVVFYASALLSRAQILHAFSTRIGGISPPPFDSLNLGNPSGGAQDNYDRIHQNYRLLQTAIDCTHHDRTWVHQVHGGTVWQVGRSTESGAKADAMVTRESKRLLSVRVADCVPILLASNDGKTVAAVHAGWRGVIAGVVINAIGAMRTDASKLIAAIGPSIGMDAFEVGPEVLREFRRVFGTSAPVRERSDGKGHVDLRAAIRLQLLSSGVAADQIDVSDRCTVRDREEFFSHRRDNGVTGRMAAIIATRG